MIDALFCRSEWGAVFLAPQADAGDPFVDQSRILPGAKVAGVVDTAGEDEVVQRSAAPLQSCEQA